MKARMAGLAATLAVASVVRPATAGAAAPLPSWADGAAKRAVVRFVAQVTDARAPTFVRPAERIAVFDNDGTLWAEMPLPAQAAFALDRVRVLVAQHPEWKKEEPFRAIIDDDEKALAVMTEHDAARIMAATHTGMTVDQFMVIAKTWFATAQNPRLRRAYADSTYAPMVELLRYLRANGFSTFIVSGGGVEFIRAYAEDAYGVLPQQVIGSVAKTRFEMRDGAPVLLKLPGISTIDNGDGKPINIDAHIGMKPILAVGNSDGDLEMLEYTDSGARPHLEMLVHHDDAEREFAYDRRAKKWGRLDVALDAAKARGWSVISMKNDWKAIFSE